MYAVWHVRIILDDVVFILACARCACACPPVPGMCMMARHAAQRTSSQSSQQPTESRRSHSSHTRSVGAPSGTFSGSGCPDFKNAHSKRTVNSRAAKPRLDIAIGIRMNTKEFRQQEKLAVPTYISNHATVIAILPQQCPVHHCVIPEYL